MKWSIIKKLTIVFGLVVAVIVLNAVLSISNILMLTQSNTGVIESSVVITQLEKTLSILKDVEIQGRNYLIVKQEDYLQAYKAAFKQTDNNIQTLKKLIPGNSQQQSANLLENKITKQFNILQEEPLFKTRGLKAAVEIVTNDIENLISDRLQIEQKLLQQRICQSQGSSRRTIATFTVMASVDLLLLALLYYYLITYITGIKLAEESLLQSENRLRAMIDAEPGVAIMEEAKLLRSQRLESIGTLAGGIAHDLNNVLSPIMMAVQLLQMKLPDQKSQQILKILENNVTRGSDLIKQLLSFAQGIESKRVLVQVKHLLNEVQQIITETFPKSITCHTDIAEHLGVVCGDTTQLHQVLMNLVVNARDAMPDGGILTILAENIEIDESYAQMNIEARIGSYIAITVADTGIGMSKEVQERIFEPFFTTKEVGNGTGLGLSTTIGIIQNHSGFVNLDSEVGKGTTFKVYLPACIHNESYSPVQEFQPVTGNGEMILVVDDEPAIREITKSSLLAYNYRVLTAGDGVEAVATYTKHQQEISLVLLDMIMPSMDGAIAMIALQNINPNVKIIAISGLPSEQKIRHAESMGIQAFLSKPCTTIELLQNINAVLSGKLG
jgi:signal transduction histidine kinase/CheY-like chemotaxis protein